MAGEVIAFLGGLDTACALRVEFQRMLQQSVQLLLLTDTQCLFDELTRGRQTVEQRLMIDMMAAREAYQSCEMENIAAIELRFNAADGFRKEEPSEALMDVLFTHRLIHPV